MRRRAFGLRPMLRAESRPFGFNPSRLRACGAARFACLRGKTLRAIPAARCLAPLGHCRTGCAGSARPAPHRMGRAGAVRRGLLRQVVRMRAVLNAGGSRPSRHEGRFTDIPPGIAMELPCHASRLAPLNAAGAFSPVVGVLTWPASGRKPVQPVCGDAEPALSPFGAVRPKASLSRCESWRWRGCASGFMAATVQRKQFPLLCHCVRRICVFRKSVTGVFGIVTDGFGNVTGDFGDVTEASSSAC